MNNVKLTLGELGDLASMQYTRSLEVGEVIEVGDRNVKIEIVCEDCHGSGVVSEGKFDNIQERKCHCVKS